MIGDFGFNKLMFQGKEVTKVEEVKTTKHRGAHNRINKIIAKLEESINADMRRAKGTIAKILDGLDQKQTS